MNADNNQVGYASKKLKDEAEEVKREAPGSTEANTYLARVSSPRPEALFCLIILVFGSYTRSSRFCTAPLVMLLPYSASPPQQHSLRWTTMVLLSRISG